VDGKPVGLSGRIDYLDAARGLSTLLMVFVNFVAQYGAIPAWTKHAPGDGFTYVDAIAPLFVFVMGISGALSFGRRRETGGLRKTVLHALRRYGLLFLFGTLGTVIMEAAFGIAEWNIFQTLAVAGLFAFAFLFVRPPWARIVAALSLMAVYQVALSLALSRTVFQPGSSIVFLPSFIQSLALATVAIFGSGLADWIRPTRGATAGIACALLCGLGFACSHLVPPNRSMGSITYLLFGLGVSAGVLFYFYLIARWFGVKRFPILSTLGRNPLVVFMIASVLTKVLNAFLPEGTGTPAVLLVAVLLEAFCIGVAAFLDRRGVYIKL
jgi:predicted acyltransferase